MSDDSFARTIRIDLHPEQKQDTPTVTFCAPATGVGGTVYSDALSENITEHDESDYNRLLECIYDAVLITDAKGVVQECNQRAIDFLLYPRNNILGACVTQFICGIDESVLSSIRKNLLEQRYTLIEGSCQRSDESFFPAEIAVNRLDSAECGRLCFFIRNISVRKRAQEALEEAVEKVERNDRQRSQFISNVSHELRTPLTSMTYAITNMIKGVVGELPAEADDYLNMLLGDCKRMLATVNDILDLRKVEDKTLKLIKTRVPYGRLIRRSAKSLQVQAEQKSINIVIKTDERLWFVDCDAQKIERVVINLVGNAVKFTSEGGNITVTVGEDDEHPGFVRVIVDDDGMGIPQEAVEHVTERYYTVGNQPSGSGLGLAISKEIVAMHGGNLTVESPVPGKDCGTRISFRMPVVEPPEVMIVEDDAADRKKLEQQVAEHGYRVVTVAEGDDVLSEISVDKPDLIVLNLALSDMEGRDVIMSLKSSPETARIPVLAMSGAQLDRSVSDLLRNFGIRVISKPWDAIELLDGIAHAFLRRTPFVLGS